VKKAGFSWKAQRGTGDGESNKGRAIALKKEGIKLQPGDHCTYARRGVGVTEGVRGGGGNEIGKEWHWRGDVGQLEVGGEGRVFLVSE